MLSFLRKLSLTQWILISMAVGTVIGWVWPDGKTVTGTVETVSADGNELAIKVADTEQRLIVRRPGKSEDGQWLGAADDGAEIALTIVNSKESSSSRKSATR